MLEVAFLRSRIRVFLDQRNGGRLKKKILATLAVAGLIAGCSTVTQSTTITVFAASSLHSSFRALADEVERQHLGTHVVISADGSQNLVDQLVAGAPADVLATADERSMKRAQEKLQLSPTAFATNTLVLATPPDNPAQITEVSEQLNQVKTVVCAPQVPCGAATKDVFAQFPWQLKPVSEEQKVADVVGKVRSGQADAGIVYRTDAKDLHTVEIPGAQQHPNRYFIANVKGDNPFTEYVLSTEGQARLNEMGFGAP